MSLVVGSIAVVVTAAVAVTALLLVRRGAPDGSYFNDGDRASGVFGVLATGFSVLLGFIVFLAFTSYDESRRGAEDEALAVAQQFQTAQFLPAETGQRAADELVCYARSIVYDEWPRMEDGTIDDRINPWGVALFRTLKAAEPRTATEQSAYDKWLDQTSERELARQARLHAADGVIPSPVWIVLFLIALVIFGYMLFFADSGERAIVQATLIGSVAIVIGAMLVSISVLDAPFRPGPGSVEPVAMLRALDILEQGRAVVGSTGSLPCTAEGVPS
jgi:Protein of unknown function (DUF4239)